VVGRALASPLNLGVAGLAGIGAAAGHSFALAALGGVTYAALVAWDLVSPDFWRKALTRREGESGAARRTLEPRTVKDPGLKKLAEAVAQAHAEVDGQLAGASADVQAQLASVRISIDELEARACGLIRSGDQLTSYLRRSDTNAIRSEIERLRARAESVSDAEARDQYEQTIKTRQEQLGVLTDIASATERISANLWRIAATLEGLSAKVVRMAAMDAQAMDSLSGDINAELERMNREIDTFEETLKPLVLAKAAEPL
jgi:hypothetical protein